VARIVSGPQITGQVRNKQTGSSIGPVTVTVNQTVYTDPEFTTGTTTLTTDGAGRFSCYAEPGTYTFTSSEPLVGPIESVEVLSPDMGAHSGTGRFLTSTEASAAYEPYRPVLPRQKLAGRKTVITSFQAGHGATSGGTGTVNLNDTTSPAITGYSQYVSVTTNGAGATATVRKSGITSIDLTAYDLEILVKMDHPESTYLEVVTTGTAFTDYYTFPLNDYTLSSTTRYVRANELTALRFSINTATPSGGTPAKTLNAIQFGVHDNSSQVGRVEFYGVYAVPKPNTAGIITISFDDLYTSQYSYALPLLSQLGMPATLYAIADRTPAQWTLTQLQDAQRVWGWEVAGHAYTTANHNTGFANLDAATRAAELRNLRSWMLLNGFSGADYLAYPGGNHDATTESDVAQVFANATTTENSPAGEIQPAEPMRWRRKLVQSSDTTGGIQALVDQAVANKSYLHLNFHDLVTSGATGPNITQANFSTIVNYIAGTAARVLPVGDVWRLGT
jgi:hypothetical protein